MRRWRSWRSPQVQQSRWRVCCQGTDLCRSHLRWQSWRAVRKSAPVAILFRDSESSRNDQRSYGLAPVLLWQNILVQPEEIVWIIMRLDRDHTIPAFVIGLGHTILLVAAHEIDIDPRPHGWAQLGKETANPGNIVGVGRGFRPVRQQIHDERSAAI